MDISAVSFKPVYEIIRNNKTLKSKFEDAFDCEFELFASQLKISNKISSQILEFIFRSGYPEVGYIVGLNSPMGLFGTLDYYLASCTSLGKALIAMVKYHAILRTQNNPPSLTRSDNGEIRLLFQEKTGHSAESFLHIEQSMAIYIKLLKRLSRGDVLPLRIVVPQGRMTKEIETLLTLREKIPVKTSEQYQIFYSEDCIRLTLPFVNEKLVKVLENDLEQELLSVRPAISTIEKVNQAIKRIPTFSEVSLQAVAKSLYVSVSSLKRSLIEEGTNFSNILLRHKKELAMKMVLKNDSKIEAVANSLGYADRSSFERAFKSWFKFTPLQLKNMTGLMGIEAKRIKDSDIFALPISSQVCQRVMQTLQKEHYDVSELCEIISSDPVLTGKLIGVASSAFYGGIEINNIEGAIVKVLGIEMVHNLTLSIMASRELHIEKCAGFDAQNNWLIALAAAEAVKHFVNLPNIRKEPDSDFLILAALLHNIGTFAIVHLRTEESIKFLELMKNSKANTDVSIQMDLQNKVFSISSFRVASLLLTHWGLPLPVCEIIKSLEKAFKGNENQKSSVKLLAYLSGYLRHFIRFSESSELTQSWVVKIAKLLALSDDEVTVRLAKVTGKFEQLNLVAKELTKNSG